MNRTTQIFVFMFIVAILLIAQFVTGAPELGNKPYIDSTGYFSIIPPCGWDIQNYPSDPRGRVAFKKKEGNESAEIQVLVQAAEVTDFFYFARKIKSNLEKIGLKPEWQPVMFSEIPAIKSVLTLSVRGRKKKFLNLRFLSGKLYHDIEFSGSTELFDKYQDVFIKTIASYEIGKRKSEGHVAAKKQKTESYLCLAKVAVEFGDRKNAVLFLDEGLKNDPENKELLDLKENFKQ
ncbi:MAG: hypothetical protein NTX32_07145 [Candidatus Firestonebacteria bacterium]|nr:hypothetical protein [Candidatus Firestonebacteria bacterium]